MTEKLYGTVFNIQHYCIHDGPGIRTGIFLKGCPLHCLWCANPESQTIHPQIFWDARQCNFCESCIKICPKNALPCQDPEYRQILGNATAVAAVLPSVRDKPVLSPESRCP